MAAAVFLVAFAVRSLYAVDVAPLMYSHEQPGTRMAARYDDTALSILRGEGVLFPSRPDPTDTRRLARPPGYPAFLAASYAVLGRSFFAVQLVQNAIDSLAPVFALLAVAAILGSRAGLLCGLMGALSPSLGYVSSLITPDGLCAVPIVAAVWLLAGTTPRPLGKTIAAGAWLGLATWLRPNAATLAPLLGVVLLLIWRPLSVAWRRAAALVLAAAAVIVPITVRNYAVYHAFVPLSINGGITLWEGIAQAGGQRFGAWERDKLVMEDEALRRGDERYSESWAWPDGIRRDRQRFRRSLAVIRAHPLWYGKATIARVGAMLAERGAAPVVAARAPAEEQIVEAEGRAAGSLEDAPRPEAEAPPPRLTALACLLPGRFLSWTRPFVRLAQEFLELTLLPAMALGAALFWLDWRRALLLFAVPLSYLLSQAPFVLEWRVVSPMHYLLLGFAAAGWVIAGSAVTAMRRR